MRLTSFALENYGNFESVRLALDAAPGRVNLVVAPNGAGKTVLRRAFRDFLFGIPGQTEMAFRFGYRDMRLFAEGVAENGAAFAIGRRKGNRNTLIDGHNNSIDPLVLKGLIGEADEGLFERLFALDSELLRKGAEAMLASGGDLAEALFAAGSGIAGLRRVREEFEGMRDALAPERKAKLPLFYQASDALAKAQAELRRFTVRPRDWDAEDAKLTLIHGQLDVLVARRARGQRQRERLDRIKRVRPWLENRQAALQRLAALEGVPDLPADTRERWRDARQAVMLAGQDRENAAKTLASLAASLAAEQPDGRLLDMGEGIDSLEGASESHRDLPPREADRRKIATDLEADLSALGVASFDEIAAIAPNGPRIAAARALIRQHGGLSENLRNAETEADRNAREMAAAKADLERLGEPRDVCELAALTAEARADGDPTRRLADLKDRLAREEARLAAALAKVPLWDRGVEALAAIVPPTRPMIDRAAAALAAAAGGLAETEREAERLRQERAKAGERLAREREGKPVPDAAAVAAARAHRDRGWSLIRRGKFEGEALAATEHAAYAGSLGLTAAFERAIREADDLADRRDAESGRLAGIAEQERIIALRDREIAGAERRLDAAREARQRAAREWVALMAGSGFETVPDPDDVREILTARQPVLDIRSARDAAQHAVDAEARRQEALRERLAKVLSADHCAALAAALTLAGQTLDRCAAIRQERDKIETRLGTFRQQHATKLAERDKAEKAIAAWQDAWRQCLTALGRPPEETPAAVEKAIDLIEEAHSKRRELRELDYRIAGMKQNIADYEAQVAAVAAAAAPDLLGQPAEIAAAELRARLRHARDVESRRAPLLQQEKDKGVELREATTRCECAEAGLDALRREIGGDCGEDIESRIGRAEQRREAKAKLTEADKNLAELGDGRTIETLAGEAAEVAAETVNAELDRLQGEDARILEEYKEGVRTEQQLRDALQRIGAGEEAIDAEERRQGALAALTRISADALLYHAAACLLRRAVERLREAGDGGLVRRIGEVFARITGGAYAGVAADEDDRGAPFLIAIEADRATAKRVEQLSEGTRDQLFLALRLVMLEDYAAKAPALPFIADDLLQTFDDYDRAANALAALADLARRVQVIVLSHQRQLIATARTLPAGTVNVCELIPYGECRARLP